MKKLSDLPKVPLWVSGRTDQKPPSPGLFNHTRHDVSVGELALHWEGPELVPSNPQMSDPL